jgi:antitoxin component YwqK of YwqJK toxin-antitoxin module
MKKFLLFILVSQSAFAQSNSNDSLKNFTDESGLKQGYWIILNNIRQLQGYAPEAKIEEGKYADNKKTGLWKMYFANGKLKSEVIYINNRPSGYAKMYYENGKLQEEGNWENNRWVGAYKSYYENGQIFYDFTYTPAGKREGVQKYFYENGQIMMNGAMHEGKETGTWEDYYENGDLRAKKAFNEGIIDADNTEVYAPKKPLQPKKEETTKEAPKLADVSKEKTNAAYMPFDGNGYAKLFLPGARVSKDGEFKNFRLMDGRDYIYNSNGILEKIAVYKGGKYVGDAPIEEKDK